MYRASILSALTELTRRYSYKQGEDCYSLGRKNRSGMDDKPTAPQYLCRFVDRTVPWFEMVLTLPLVVTDENRMKVWQIVNDINCQIPGNACIIANVEIWFMFDQYVYDLDAVPSMVKKAVEVVDRMYNTFLNDWEDRDFDLKANIPPIAPF